MTNMALNHVPLVRGGHHFTNLIVIGGDNLLFLHRD